MAIVMEQLLQSSALSSDLAEIVANVQQSVVLVRGRRGLSATVLLAVVTGMTQVWEPYRYGALFRHHAAWVSFLLLVRDLLVVAMLAVLVWPRRSELQAEELEPAGATGV